MMSGLLSQVLIFGAVVLAVIVLSRLYQDLRSQVTERVRVSMDDLFWFIDPALVFRSSLLLLWVLPMGAWLLTRAWPMVAGAALAAAVMPRLIYQRMRARRLQKIVRQMPDALALLAASLRAGGSLQMALSVVVNECSPPLSQELSMVLREQRLGMTLEDSLDGLSKRVPLEDMALWVSAMNVAKDVGGNLAEILDRLATTLRLKAAMEGKVRALTAQGKMQAWVVSLLPMALGGVIYLLDPEAMAPMFTTVEGGVVMSLVAILLALGGFFVRKIVTIDL